MFSLQFFFHLLFYENFGFLFYPFSLAVERLFRQSEGATEEVAPLFYLEISSIKSNSSRVKEVLCNIPMLSRICSGLEAPIRTEVTSG